MESDRTDILSPSPAPGPASPAPVPGALPFTLEFPNGLLRGARGSLQAPVDVPPGKYRLVPVEGETT